MPYEFFRQRVTTVLLKVEGQTGLRTIPADKLIDSHADSFVVTPVTAGWRAQPLSRDPDQDVGTSRASTRFWLVVTVNAGRRAALDELLSESACAGAYTAGGGERQRAVFLFRNAQ